MNPASPRHESPGRWLAGTCAGLLLWASCFVGLYGGLSLGCEAAWHTLPGPGGSRLVFALALVWAVHLLALAALLAWMTLRWPRHGVLPTLSRTLTWAALVATLWIGWPVLALPPCAGFTPPAF